MAASFAAQLLDELMGRNRDANPNDKRRDIHWSDPEVCKYFICGICPHDLFTNTRSDLGACTKIHDESVKKDYERSSRHERMGYEEELLKYLSTVIVEADRRISRGQQRLLMAASEHTVPPTPEQIELDNKIEAIQQQMNELVAEAESLGNEGMVDAARDKTTQCDQLRAERLKLQELHDKMSRPLEEVYKRRPMEVCDICGAMLFVDDAPQRLDDHIMGKQHMGYARIRSYITAYQKKKDEKRGPAGENGSGSIGKTVDGVKEGSGEVEVDGKTTKSEAIDISKDNDTNTAATLRTVDEKLSDRRGGRDEDGRRRDDRDRDQRRDSRHHRSTAAVDDYDNSSRRRSRDRDSHRPGVDRERHKSSEHSRPGPAVGRSDRSRSRSRSRRSSHTDRHRSRDRSRSRSRREGSRSRHGSRRSNHSRD